MTGGAMCKITNAKRECERFDEYGRSRTVWLLSLACGATKRVTTLPGTTARCPVCRPKREQLEAIKRCRGCQEMKRIYQDGHCSRCHREAHGANVKTKAGPEYAEPAQTRELAPEWFAPMAKGKKGQRNPAWWWR